MTGEEAPSLRVHTHSSTKEKGDRAFEKDAQTARNARRDNTRIYEYFQNKPPALTFSGGQNNGSCKGDERKAEINLIVGHNRECVNISN